MSQLPRATIYTDGSCDPNPGPGGWAALLIFASRQIPITGSEVQTTNNRMELTAAVEALRALPGQHHVDLYTDSEYLKRGITEWMPGWQARGWKRKGGKLANVDLWKSLDAALKIHQVSWHWVRGHAFDPRNQQVDRLAREARQRGQAG